MTSKAEHILNEALLLTPAERAMIARHLISSIDELSGEYGDKEQIEQSERKTTVVRNSLGLAIAGTRITLYDIMDYITQDWYPKQIQQWFDLTDKQIADAMTYIEMHRDEVEAEYEQVLQYSEEKRRYWNDRNQEHLAQIAAMPDDPGREEIRAKLAEWKARLNLT